MDPGPRLARAAPPLGPVPAAAHRRAGRAAHPPGRAGVLRTAHPADHAGPLRLPLRAGPGRGPPRPEPGAGHVRPDLRHGRPEHGRARHPDAARPRGRLRHHHPPPLPPGAAAGLGVRLRGHDLLDRPGPRRDPGGSAGGRRLRPRRLRRQRGPARRLRRHAARPRLRCPGGAPAGRRLRPLPRLRPLRRAGVPRLRAAGAARVRRRVPAGQRARVLVGLAARGAARAAGRPGRRVHLRRQPGRAHAGARRGRDGPPGHLVQPDGGQHPGPDRPARAALPDAAAVRLGRLPRAAHPADHRADGRGRALRLPRRLRPRQPPLHRAALPPGRPLPGHARRPARDHPVRRRRRHPGPRGDRHARARPRRRSHRPAAGGPDRRARLPGADGPGSPGRLRGVRGPAPHRAHPAQPGEQRDRARRGPARGRARGRRRRGRQPGRGGPRHRHEPRGGAARVRPVLARRPLAQAHHGRLRARPGDRHRGHPPARRTARGLGRAGGGLHLHGDPAAAAARDRPGRRGARADRPVGAAHAPAVQHRGPSVRRGPHPARAAGPRRRRVRRRRPRRRGGDGRRRRARGGRGAASAARHAEQALLPPSRLLGTPAAQGDDGGRSGRDPGEDDR